MWSVILVLRRACVGRLRRPIFTDAREKEVSCLDIRGAWGGVAGDRECAVPVTWLAVNVLPTSWVLLPRGGVEC